MKMEQIKKENTGLQKVKTFLKKKLDKDILTVK